MESSTEDCEVKDVTKAKDIALNHLAKQGIVVFSREINSIFKKGSAWFVMIESAEFNGVMIIKSGTGEVLAMVKL